MCPPPTQACSRRISWPAAGSRDFQRLVCIAGWAEEGRDLHCQRLRSNLALKESTCGQPCKGAGTLPWQHAGFRDALLAGWLHWHFWPGHAGNPNKFQPLPASCAVSRPRSPGRQRHAVMLSSPAPVFQAADPRACCPQPQGCQLLPQLWCSPAPKLFLRVLPASSGLRQALTSSCEACV